MAPDRDLLDIKPSRLGWLSRALAMTSVILLGLSFILFQDTTKRMGELQTGVKEDSLWAIYQLDRSNSELLEKLTILKDGNGAVLKDIKLAYDILWSRADLLTKAAYLNTIRFDPELKAEIQAIAGTVKEQAPFFDALSDRTGFDRAQLESILSETKQIREQGKTILMDANAAISIARSNSRFEILKRQTLSAYLFIALVVTALVLIVLLYRQISETVKTSQRIKLMANELHTAYEAAEAGNWAKTRFLATVSHEIRTPLNSILGLSDIVLEQKLEKVVRNDVRQIRDSGVFLLDILNEVLDYSSLESGKLNFATQNFDLREFMEKTVAVFGANAAKKGLDLRLHVTPEGTAPLMVQTDPTRLRQVLMNFISNAIKFTEKGSVSVNIELKSKANAACDLSVSVRDTGMGIAADSLNKLFQPFSQVDASVSRRFGGTGLGLAISKGIAEKMGGEIGAESTLGVGSNFFVHLPVKAGQAEIAPAITKPTSDESNIEAMKILVVDDNTINLRIMQRRLEALSHAVDAAASGADALILCEDNRYDVIFMDMQMPNMSGIEAAAKIRSTAGPNQQTPIFALTANAAPADKMACLAAGMNGFETKPLSADAMRSILQSVHGKNSGKLLAIEQHTPMSQEVKLMDNLAPDGERIAELISEIGEECFLELWDAFCSEANHLLTGLKKDLEGGHLVETRAKLHTLKGAAANIGLTSVASLADHLRTLSDEQEIARELVRLKSLEDGTLRDHFQSAA